MLCFEELFHFSCLNTKPLSALTAGKQRPENNPAFPVAANLTSSKTLGKPRGHFLFSLQHTLRGHEPAELKEFSLERSQPGR